MTNINKIIEEILLEHSLTYPIPSLEDKNQVSNLMECCDKLGYPQYKDIIREFFLNEEEPIKGASSQFKGKFHLGGGYYSSKPEGDVEFKNDNGNLRPVTPEEKADFQQKKSSTSDKPIHQKVKKVATQTIQKVADTTTQHVDKIKGKIENWSEEEKAFFAKNQQQPGSETRRTFAEALRDKVKGAGAAIKHGFQHETHLFKQAAGAAHKWIKGEELTPEDKKSMIKVGVKVATTAVFGAAMGGLGHGGVAFAKHVAAEFVPHVVGEVIVVGAIKSTLFADINDDERVLMDFANKIADGLENSEISPDVMEQIVDSWNEKKGFDNQPIEQPQNEAITIDSLLESLLVEAEGESSQFPGKYHLGGGYYATQPEGDVQFKNDNGNLRPVTPEEKADYENKKGELNPSDQEKAFKTAEKVMNDKEKEIESDNKIDAKKEPEKVLMDPEASAKDRARARAFKAEKDNLDIRREDDPDYQTELKKTVKGKLSDISNDLRNEKDSDGNQLDSEITENGSILIGVEHGEDNDTTKNIINKITSLPKDAKIVFIGEGGSSYDENGRIEFNGEQKEIRDAYMNHFKSPREESWDENADITDSNSPVFAEVANVFEGDKKKALASIWTNMVGQGDKLDANEYLTDETKKWIVDEAKKGGSDEFNGDIDWNNLSLEQKEDLYQLNYRDDQNYGETELSKGQKAYNDFRQKELDRKIKEVEDNGGIAIATMGNSHVGSWRERNKPQKDTFNPSSLRTLGKEMPEADKDVFNKNSDIEKIPAAKREEISMKIDELADKASKGEDFNLCQVTVPGTNLYCDGNQGIPREEMPQFKGKPLPGTPAESMPKDSKGEVDTEPLFKKMLKEKGIKTIETEVPSDRLKATQSELVGGKVAGMTKALEEDPNHPKITAPIYVSRDGYVIDGHHRWAAVTSNAIKNGKPANMKVIVVDMDIKDAIPMCNKFAEEQGIAAKKADANDGNLPAPKEPNEKQGGVIYPIGGNYYSDTPNGPAQYIKAESVVKEIFINENENFLHLLFEENISKKLPDGDDIIVKPIDVKDQPEATKQADIEDSNESNINVTPLKGKDYKDFATKQMNQSKYKDSILDDNLKQQLSTIIDKMSKGEDLSDEEKAIAKDYIKIAKTDKEVKMYIASKKKGDWSQQGYIKVKVGTGKEARQWADDASKKYGVTSGKAGQGAVGKKEATPAKIIKDRKINTIEIVDESTVVFNGKTIKKLSVPSFEEVKAKFKEKEPNLSDSELNKKASIAIKRIKKRNDNIDELVEISKNSGGKFESVDIGDVTTSEGRNQTRVKIMNESISLFTKLLGDKIDLPENKKAMETLQKIKDFEGSDLETNDEKRKEYQSLLDELEVDMTNSKDFRDGISDFSEVKVALELLSKGNAVYLPSDEAFKTADVLVINEINENESDIQFLFVTLEFSGGISVKYQGGAGGTSDEKWRQSRFNSNETRRRGNRMLSTYDFFYAENRTPPSFPPSSDQIEQQKTALEDDKKWMLENGIANEEELNGAEKWAEKRVSSVIGKFKDNGVFDCLNDDEKKRFEESMLLYYKNQKVSEVLYNNDLDYTNFGNSNQKLSISKGKAVRCESENLDGVEKPCYMKIKDDVGFNYSQQGNCMTVKPTNRNPSEIHSHKPKIK